MKHAKLLASLILVLFCLPALAFKCPPGSFFANNANKVFNQTIQLNQSYGACAGIMGAMQCYKVIYVPAKNEPALPWSLNTIIYAESEQDAIVQSDSIFKSLYEATPGTNAGNYCIYKVDSPRIVEIKAAPNKTFKAAAGQIKTGS